MRHALSILLFLTAFAAVGQEDALEPAVSEETNTVVVCPVTGMIDPGVAVLIERAVKEAEELGAKAIIFEVDTPGGRIDSAVKITSTITDTDILTIAHIKGMGGISAGAMISLACDQIVMEPGSAIGAATPVIATAEGMHPLGEKEVSFMRAKMRSLAESNGHNPDIAQAMVDKDIELRGHRDADGTYVVYAMTTTASTTDDAPVRKTSPEAKTPVEDILRSVTGDAADDSAEEREPVRATTTAPGAVVYEDGSELLLAAGKLLTITPKEAEKYGLIRTIVADRDETAGYFELGPLVYHEVNANWAEKVFRFLTSPTIAGLLLMVGLGGLYFEVRTPGFGLPGTLAVLALMLLFGSHFVLGLADTLDIALLLAGFILLGVEAFLIPGFGVAGVAGILCILVGSYLALVSFTIPQYSWDYERLGEVGYSMTVALALTAGLVIVTWRFLPKSPLYRALVAGLRQERDLGYVSPVQDALTPEAGMRGVASSMLRPVGRAKFDGKTLQVVTQGAYLQKGTKVEIIDVDGGRIVVEERKETS